MAKLILHYGIASVNCKHGSGQTPLMEAFLRKNTQMVKLLRSKGADLDAECESSTSNLFHDCSFKAYEEKEWLYNRGYKTFRNSKAAAKSIRIRHK
jgi:ankyrin repeat protein